MARRLPRSAAIRFDRDQTTCCARSMLAPERLPSVALFNEGVVMKKMNMFAASAVLGLAVAAAPASAQSDTGIKAGDVLVRVRAILVAPNESTSGITPTFPTEHASVNNSVMPEVDVTY